MLKQTGSLQLLLQFTLVAMATLKLFPGATTPASQESAGHCIPSLSSIYWSHTSGLINNIKECGTRIPALFPS